ncbi:MAG: 4Fe-4S dicluster domain-containing protein [Granulosicoccaceae bacterium]|jgi:formate hydrogenlyase subunit 6/NADH:ubiquinone oxidoreductase subunit I
MKRRRFLKQVSAMSVLALAAATPYGLSRLLSPTAYAAPHRHIPLPGALPDPDDFVRACIGCGLCGEVCPPRCIEFKQREGADQVNTPYINPEKKACILCNKCMEVCPTDALTVTPVRDVRMGIAQIDRSACYPWVDEGICGACVVICPLGEDAIGFEFANIYKPAVREGCVGCGQCVEVCPEPSLPIRIVDRSEGTVARHGVAARRRSY